MTTQGSPDTLDLAEAVADGRLSVDEAERQLRAGLGPGHDDASEKAVRDLRQLIAAARAVRSHVSATREAWSPPMPDVAHSTTSMTAVVPGPVRAGVAHRRAASGGDRRAPRRTWLLVAAVLALGAGVIGASVVGGRLVSPKPDVPVNPNEVWDPSATPKTSPKLTAAPSPVVAKPGAPSWTATGSMITPRTGQMATLLPDGRVLVAGGVNYFTAGSGGKVYSSAELYDPSTGSWTATGSMLSHAGPYDTLTLLPNGKVLVAGASYGSNGVPASTAELYDPATGTWTATGNMVIPRDGSTATMLHSGKVLVVGGNDTRGNRNSLASAELYDPATGTWTATGSMGTGRTFQTATLLADGRVLVLGGLGANGRLASAELYDPATASWTATASMGASRESYTATLLPDGEVLVAGGGGSSSYLASAELYDPGTGTWTATGSMGEARALHTATLLPNGKVLVAGDWRVADGDTAELYDPGSGTWTSAGKMNLRRVRFTATLLPDSKVLVAGGGFVDPNHTDYAAAELYNPGSGK
jgi:WD40 repeat protein